MRESQVATKTFAPWILVFDIEYMFLLTNYQKFNDSSYNVPPFLYTRNTVCDDSTLFYCSQYLDNLNLEFFKGSEMFGAACCFYSVAPVRKRTIPTERPPLVGEVNANFYG
jgi:hypothetical protein